MSFTDLLNAEAVIERLSGSGQDSYGQPVQTWTEVTRVQCRIEPVRRLNPQILGPMHQAVISTHRVFLPAGIDIQARDRLLCSSAAYRVLFVRDAAGAGHHLEADLEMISS